MQAGNKVFLGLSVSVPPLLVKENNSPDMQNVSVSEYFGTLTNIKGMEKQFSSAKAGTVSAIHQLNGEIFVLEGSNFWKE